MAEDRKLTNVEQLMGELNTHIADNSNPHKVSKAQVPGLDKVDNTTDESKPISIYGQTALSKKVNIADVYDKLEDTEGVNLKGVAASAHLGVRLNEQIKNLDPANWDVQINDLDTRVKAVETWTD